jgi:hypothetical protein
MSDLSALQQILAGLTSVNNAHRSQYVSRRPASDQPQLDPSLAKLRSELTMLV